MDPAFVERIATAVTPAVLVSACGLIALGLDNQAGRMTSRTRELARELRGLPEGHPRRRILEAQIRILLRRHNLLCWALELDYASLLSLVLTSLLSIVTSVRLVPALTFVAAVVLLGGVAVLALASLRLSRTAIRLEAEGALLGE